MFKINSKFGKNSGKFYMIRIARKAKFGRSKGYVSLLHP